MCKHHLLFCFIFPECPVSAVSDLVFLIDGSWSVGRPNFKYIRSFVSAVAGAFPIGKDRTRVGVVQYSDDARTEFRLNEHLTRVAVLRAIVSLPYKGGDTMTGRSIHQSEDGTRTGSEHRPDQPSRVHTRSPSDIPLKIILFINKIENTWKPGKVWEKQRHPENLGKTMDYFFTRDNNV